MNPRGSPGRGSRADVAAALGIASQAVSERLRRAYYALATEHVA